MIPQFIERPVFATGLRHPKFFRKVVRPQLYRMADGDPEEVHRISLTKLNQYEDMLERFSSRFDIPELRVSIAGQAVSPFGTAAGLDKNGDALKPLSHVFGFQEPGTIVVKSRTGNKQPRVAVDNEKSELYNAQGFPSKGLSYFLENIEAYRKSGGHTPLLVSVTGIPPEPGKTDVAFDELEQLLRALNPHADGFVTNFYSPNTAALAELRTPENFQRSAELVKKHAGGKLSLVKMGPYTSRNLTDWEKQTSAWVDGGGDGFVVVNTSMVPKEKVPSKDWGYPSAGRSGTFLQSYRAIATRNLRHRFPEKKIIATGGIDSPLEAMRAFEQGADALEGYTPYTFQGFGLVREMAEGVKEKLERKGYGTLREFQSAVRDGTVRTK